MHFSFGSVTFEQNLKGAENYVRSQWQDTRRSPSSFSRVRGVALANCAWTCDGATAELQTKKAQMPRRKPEGLIGIFSQFRAMHFGSVLENLSPRFTRGSSERACTWRHEPVIMRAFSFEKAIDCSQLYRRSLPPC